MRQVATSLVVLAIMTMTVSVVEGMRPPYIKCVSSEECGKEACCVIGMGRYSIPSCQTRRDRGDQCRPFGEPANTTLSYPDGATVHLQGVYYVHCPCLGGLSCEEVDETPVCADSTLSNHLGNYDYDSQDVSAQRS